MLKDADFRYKKSTIVPLARGLKLARTNKNNIMFSLFKTPQRDNSFNWVGPIGTSNIVILAKKNHKFNAKDPLLAGQRDSGSMETAIKNGFTNIVEVNEYIKGLALINANRADGWIVGLDAAEHLIKDTRLSFEDYYVFKTLSKSDLYYVINKNSDKRIVEFLSQKLKKMKRNGEFKQIASKYGITN
jgi:polar amino acid transport system substrate-binding protein